MYVPFFFGWKDAIAATNEAEILTDESDSRQNRNYDDTPL